MKYKGRKMDYYKNLWIKMKSEREKMTAAAMVQQNDHEDDHDEDEVEEEGR